MKIEQQTQHILIIAAMSYEDEKEEEATGIKSGETNKLERMLASWGLEKN